MSGKTETSGLQAMKRGRGRPPKAEPGLRVVGGQGAEEAVNARGEPLATTERARDARAAREARRRDPAWMTDVIGEYLKARAVRRVNETYAFVRDKAGTRIAEMDVDAHGRPFVTFRTRDDFQAIFANRSVSVPVARYPRGKGRADEKDRDGNPVGVKMAWQEIALGKLWFEHPWRREARGVDYRPGEPDFRAFGDKGDDAHKSRPSDAAATWRAYGVNPWAVLEGKRHPDVFNLWRGWGVDPLPADCQRVESGWHAGTPVSALPFLRHLHEIVCSGDDSLYEYVVCWLAQAFQDPLDVPGTALVLQSEEKGTGKGWVDRFVRAMAGTNGLQLNRPSDVVGQFNGVFQGKLFLTLDEVFIRDPHAAQIVKSVITEPTISIELKKMEKIEIRNLARLIFMTNERHAILAERTERRYLALKVSDRMRKSETDGPKARAEKDQWWDTLKTSLEGDGPAAVLRHLLEVDTEAVDLRKPPVTELLVDQIARSLYGVDRWWFECLTAGEVPLPDEDGKWPETLTNDELEASFQAHARKRRLPTYHVADLNALRDWMTGESKPVGGRPTRTSRAGARKRGVSVPDLDEARRNFAAWLEVPEHMLFRHAEGLGEDD